MVHFSKLSSSWCHSSVRSFREGHHSCQVSGEYKVNATIYGGSSLLGSDIDRLNERWAPSGSEAESLWGSQWVMSGQPAATEWGMWCCSLVAFIENNNWCGALKNCSCPFVILETCYTDSTVKSHSWLYRIVYNLYRVLLSRSCLTEASKEKQTCRIQVEVQMWWSRCNNWTNSTLK